MASNNLPGKMYLQDMGEDHLGAYMKVLVTLDSGQYMIRWGLDFYTYQNLKKALSKITFHAKALLYLLPTIANDSLFGYIGSLQITDKNGHTNEVRSFACSELFASNLAWIESITYSYQLKSLLWKEPFQYHDKTIRAQDHVPIIKRSRKHKRGWFPKITMASSILVLSTLCFTEVFHFWKASADTQVRKDSIVIPTYDKLASTTDKTQKLQTNVKLESEQMSHKTASITTANTNIQQDKTDSAAVQNSTNDGDAGKLVFTNDSHVPIIYGVDEGEVGLTFDDGPSAYTNEIVSTLSNYHVHATFFFVGNRVSQWADAVKNAVEQGNSIGDHSDSHPLLTQISYDAQQQQIIYGANDIQAYTAEKVTLFRPPYGSYNQVTVNALRNQHMVMALWNRDPQDWAAKSSTQIVNAVITNHPSGGIFDLHENKLTAAALPQIIENLQHQGLKLVVLHDPDSNNVKHTQTLDTSKNLSIRQK